MSVYYNEFDKKKCAALKQLMIDGHISKGDIDDRPIQEVMPDDVKGYKRAHFFAGIGLWDYALNLAGWEKDSTVWTGSCPCQPFSSAGRQNGKADDRHLWPEWFRLIEECEPSTIFGEQVSTAITHGWLDDVYQGLEAQEYAVGSVVLPASAVGAPHRRERLWFVGDTELHGYSTSEIEGSDGSTVQYNKERSNGTCEFKGTSDSSDVAHTNRQRPQGYWEEGVWIDCPDGKERLVEPTIPLLADGFPERVGVIHCAGDAIVPQVAAEVIRTMM